MAEKEVGFKMFRKKFNKVAVKKQVFGGTTIYTGFAKTQADGSESSFHHARLNELYKQLGVEHKDQEFMGFGGEFFFEADGNEKKSYKVTVKDEEKQKTFVLENKGKKRPKGTKPFVLMVFNEGLVKKLKIEKPPVKGNPLLGRKYKPGTGISF